MKELVVQISPLQYSLFGVDWSFISCFRVVGYFHLYDEWFIPIINSIVVMAIKIKWTSLWIYYSKIYFCILYFLFRFEWSLLLGNHSLIGDFIGEFKILSWKASCVIRIHFFNWNFLLGVNSLIGQLITEFEVRSLKGSWFIRLHFVNGSHFTLVFCYYFNGSLLLGVHFLINNLAG